MTKLSFTRLSEIAPGEIANHMNDPRMSEHMPLLQHGWDGARVAEFVAAKEACWARDGLGHWAFLAEGRYVGWGGFQLEDGEWDFGVVLRPDAFGLGPLITRQAIDFATRDERIEYVVFLLAPSRRSLGALKRMGAREVAEVIFEGEAFLKFRLDTPNIAA